MKKDAEAEKRFGEVRVKTLKDTVTLQQAQIAALEKQLADAKQQVQDISVVRRSMKMAALGRSWDNGENVAVLGMAAIPAGATAVPRQRS